MDPTKDILQEKWPAVKDQMPEEMGQTHHRGSGRAERQRRGTRHGLVAAL